MSLWDCAVSWSFPTQCGNIILAGGGAICSGGWWWVGYQVNLKCSSTAAQFHPSVTRWGPSGEGEVERGWGTADNNSFISFYFLSKYLRRAYLDARR